MRPWCVRWLLSCVDECHDERPAERHARVACCGSHRYAQRIHRFERAGAERACEQSALRSDFRLSRAARRSTQAVVVGWNRTLLDGQTFGARSLYLASGAEWERIAECSATLDVTRRNRLATSRAHR